VDKKRIVITEEVVREILQLNDAEGVVCLLNEEIFAGLARIGYKKPSTKLNFYKAFFSTQWKFFIHTILHSLSAKRTSWNEFSSAMASALICLSSGQRFNFSKYIFESLVRNVDSSSKFYMYHHFIQLIIQTNIADLSKHTNRYISPVLTQNVFANMRRVGRGFSGVETPLFETMLAVRDVAEEAEEQADDVQKHAAEEVATDVVSPTPTSPSPSSPVLDTCSALAHRVAVLENDKVAQQLEIVKLKARVLAASTPIPAAKPKTLTITAAPAVSTRRRKGVVIRDPEEELHINTLAETPTVKDKGKEILIEAPKPMKKKDQVEMDAEYAKKLQEELDKEHEEAYKNIDWNAALDHVQSKEPQYIKRYHGIKKKPQTESEACKNMISFLKNTEGYKMEFFKGKTYDEILPIFQARFDANMKFLLKSREEIEKEDEEIIKSVNETHAQKAAKKRKLSKEAQEADVLRRRLEIVQDKDDDVFVEAIPLAQKVPVVDYQIVVIDNKP
nr:hypothetical protein [Tanacetum cinerariifolium]